MKKYLTLIIILMLACVGLVYGCDKDKYKDLTYSVTYGQNASITQDKGLTLVYGDSNNDNSTITVSIDGVKGINKRVGITSDNKDVVLVKDITFQNDKTYAILQAIAPGTANINIVSLEYSKASYSFPVKVTYPITAITTTYDETKETLALVKNGTINLNEYINLIPNTPYMTTDTDVKFEIVQGGVNNSGASYVDVNGGIVRVIGDTIPKEETIVVRVSSINNPNIYKDIEIVAISSDQTAFSVVASDANVNINDIKLISHDDQYNRVQIVATAASNNVYYKIEATSSSDVICQPTLKTSGQITGAVNSTVYNYDLVAKQEAGNANIKFSFVPYKYGYGTDAKIFVNSKSNYDATVAVENVSLAVGITTSIDGEVIKENEQIAVFDSYPEGSYTTFRYSLQAYSNLKPENSKLKFYIQTDGGLTLNPTQLFTVFSASGLPIEAQIDDNNQFYYLLNNDTNYYITAKSSAIGQTYIAKAEAINQLVPNGYTGEPAKSQFVIVGQRGVDSLVVNNAINGQIYLLKDEKIKVVVENLENARIDDLICVPSSNNILVLEQNNSAFMAEFVLQASVIGEYELSFIAGNGYTQKITAMVGDSYQETRVYFDTNNPNITNIVEDLDNKIINITAKAGYDISFYINALPYKALVQNVIATVDGEVYDGIKISNDDPYIQNDRIGSYIVKTGDTQVQLTLQIANFKKDAQNYLVIETINEVWTVNINGISTSTISLEDAILQIYDYNSLGYNSNVPSSASIRLNFGGESSLYNYLNALKTEGVSIKTDGSGIKIGDDTASIEYSLLSAIDSFNIDWGIITFENNTIVLNIDKAQAQGTSTCYIEIKINEYGQESSLIVAIDVLQAITTNGISITNPDGYNQENTPIIYLKKDEVKKLSVAISPNNITNPGYTYFFKEGNKYTSQLPDGIKIVNDQLVVTKSNSYEIYLVANDSIKQYETSGNIVIFENLSTAVYEKFYVFVEDGTKNSPYNVRTVDDLMGIMHQNLSANGETEKTYYQLVADIDISTIQSTIDGGLGFGNSLSGYNVGTGKTYKLYNFNYINNSFSGNFGLFSRITSEGELTNLNVIVDNITITTLEEDNIDNIGVFAGINEGLIANCSATINKMLVNAKASANIGAIVGKNSGALYNYYIDETNDYRLPTTIEKLNEVLDKSSSTNIASGSIIVNSDKPVNVGGLIGLVDSGSTVKGIFEVYEKINQLTQTGGDQSAEFVVTFESQGVDSSININAGSGEITNINSSVGGVVGSIGTHNNSCESINVSYLSSESVIGYRLSTQYSVNGNVGGVIGAVYGKSYSSNFVTNVFASGFIKANGNVGGMVGYISKATIDDSRVEIYETKSNKASAIIANGNVGGIVGLAENAQFRNVYIKTYFTSEMKTYGIVGTYNGDILLLSNGQVNNVGAFAGKAENVIFDTIYTTVNMQYYYIADVDINKTEKVNLSSLIADANRARISNFYAIAQMQSNIDGVVNDVALEGNNEALNVYSICKGASDNRFSVGYVAVMYNGDYIEALSDATMGSAEGEIQTKPEVIDGAFEYNGKTYTKTQTYASRQILVAGEDKTLSDVELNTLYTIEMTDGRKLEVMFKIVNNAIQLNESEYENRYQYIADYKLYSQDSTLIESGNNQLLTYGNDRVLTVDGYFDILVNFENKSLLEENIVLEDNQIKSYGFDIVESDNAIVDIQKTDDVNNQDIKFKLKRVGKYEYSLTSNVFEGAMQLFSSDNGSTITINDGLKLQFNVKEYGAEEVVDIEQAFNEESGKWEDIYVYDYVYYNTDVSVIANNLILSSIIYNDDYVVIEDNKAYLESGEIISFTNDENDSVVISLYDVVDINEVDGVKTFEYDGYAFRLTEEDGYVLKAYLGDVLQTTFVQDQYTTLYSGELNGKTYVFDIELYVKDSVTNIQISNISSNVFVADNVEFTYQAGVVANENYTVYRSTIKNNLYVAVNTVDKDAFYFEINGSQVTYVHVVKANGIFLPESQDDVDSYILSNNGLPVLLNSATNKPLIDPTPQNIDLYPSIDAGYINRTIITAVDEGYEVQLVTGNVDENIKLEVQSSTQVQPELVLYYNSNIIEGQTNTNEYQLEDLLDIKISPSMVKNIRIICDYDSQIISIDNNGKLTINGIGRATIDFSAIKNYSIKDKVDILIKPYVEGFRIYNNANMTDISNANNPVGIRRNNSYTFYPAFYNGTTIIDEQLIVDYNLYYLDEQSQEYIALDSNVDITIQNNTLSIGALTDEEAQKYKNIKIEAYGYYNSNGIKVFANVIDKAEVYVNIQTQAKNIYTNTNAVELAPMDSISFVVNVDTDNADEAILLELRDKSGNIVNLQQSVQDDITTLYYVTKSVYVSGVVQQQKTGLVIEISGTGISRLVTMYLLEGNNNAETMSYRYLEEALNYSLKLYPESNQNVSTQIAITIKPQELLGLDMVNRALLYEGTVSVGSKDVAYIFSDNTEYLLNPGSVSLIEIDAFPFYSNVGNLQISTTSLADNQEIKFDQIYINNSNSFELNTSNAILYTQANGTLNLNLISDVNGGYNGKIYVRAIIPSNIYQDSTFTIEIKGTRENATITNEMHINVRKVPQIQLVAERDKIVKFENSQEGQDRVKFTLTYSEEFNAENINLSLVKYPIEDKNNPQEVGNIILEDGEYYAELFKTEETSNAPQYGENIAILARYSAIINGTLVSSEVTYVLTVVDYYIENVSVKNTNADNILNLPVNNTQRLTADIEGIGSLTVKEELEQNISRALNNSQLAQNWYYVDATGIAKSIDDASLTGLPYQVQKVNLNSSSAIISLRGLTQGAYCNLRLSFDAGYNNGKIILSSNEDSSQTYNYDFILNVYLNAVEDNPEPIYSEEQFYNMQPGGDYILMADLELNNHTPMDIDVASLDGNNKIITINSFNILETDGVLHIGLFSDVSADTVIKNIIVALPANNAVATPLNNYSNVYYGGLAAINNGIITNSETIALYPDNTTYASYVFNATTSSTINGQNTAVYVGGLVGQNNGIITNSRVGRAEVIKVNYDSQLSVSTTYLDGVYNKYLIRVKGRAVIGGFAAQNTGSITSCYVDNIQIENDSVSSDLQKTAGFVAENGQGASITGSYVKGWYVGDASYEEAYYKNGIKTAVTNPNPYIEEGEENIYRMMGGGIYASGNAGGFVYQNEGSITDCYSSVNLKGNVERSDVNLSVGGFVYSNMRGGEISTSYSMSNIRSETSCGPFTGFGLDGTLLVEEGSSITKSYYLQEKDQDLYKQEDPAYVINQQIAFDLGDEDIEDESTEANKFIDPKSFGGFSFDSLEYSVIEEKYDLKSGSIWAMKLLGQENGYPELISANDIAISVRIWDSKTDDGKNIYQYAEGYSIGSTTNPLVISDAKQFVNVFKNYYDALKGIFQNVEFEAKYQGNIRLIDNISFTDDIDSEIKDFDISKFTITSNKDSISIIDGNNLTISGINLSTQSELPSYGLFKGLYGAGVKNLTLDISKISADYAIAVGGLAGVIVDSDINNVNIISSVKVDEEQVIKGSRFVGGLAGIIIASPITDPESDVNVHNINSVYANVSVVASYTVDGDVSLTSYDKLSSKNIWNAIAPPSVTGISNNSDLQYKNLSNFSVGFAGGIAGVIDLSQNFSLYEEGVVRAIESANVTSVKVDYGVVDNPLNITGVNAGGLFGFVGNETYIYGAEFITLSSNIGAKHFINAKLIAGGITAINYGRIERAMVTYHESEQEQFDIDIANFAAGNTSTVEIGSGELFTGTPYYIGGIAGFNSVDNYEYSGYISDTYNRVNIHNAQVNNNGAIGGIVGLSYYSTIRLSYTTSSLMGGPNTAIGGLIGETASTNFNGSASSEQSVLSVFYLNALNVFAPTTDLQNYYKNRAQNADGTLIGVSGFIGKNSLDVNYDFDLEEIRVPDKLYATYSASGAQYGFDSNNKLPSANTTFDKSKFSTLMNFTSEGQVSVATRQEFFDESYWKYEVWSQSLDLVLPRLIFGYNPSIVQIYNADQFIEYIVNSSGSSSMYVIMNDIDMSLVSDGVTGMPVVDNNFRGKIFGSKTYVGGRNPILFNIDIANPLFKQLYNSTISGVNFHIATNKSASEPGIYDSYGTIVGQMSRSTLSRITVTNDLSSLLGDDNRLYVNKKNNNGDKFEEEYSITDIGDGGYLNSWIEVFTLSGKELSGAYSFETNEGISYTQYYNGFTDINKDKGKSITDYSSDIERDNFNFGLVVGLASSSYINNINVNWTTGVVANVASDDRQYNQYNIGGIVGEANGQIINSNVSIAGGITVNGTTTEKAFDPTIYVGGLVGHYTISISNILVEANITINNITAQQLYIGGILGGFDDENTYDSYITTKQEIIYNGDLTIGEKVKVKNNLYVGGIAGKKGDKNNSSYVVNGDITVNNTDKKTQIDNQMYVGGLFGYMSNGNLTGSSYNGTITIDKLSDKDAYIAGGIAYQNNIINISSNLISADIDINDSAQNSSVLYVGGLIGLSNGIIHFLHEGESEIFVFADINNKSLRPVYSAGVVGCYAKPNIYVEENIYYVGDIINTETTNIVNIAGVFNKLNGNISISSSRKNNNQTVYGKMYTAMSVYYKGLSKKDNDNISQFITAELVNNDYFTYNAYFVESLLFAPMYNINYLLTDNVKNIEVGQSITQNTMANEINILKEYINSGSYSSTKIKNTALNFDTTTVAGKYLTENDGVSKIYPIVIDNSSYSLVANKHYTLADDYTNNSYNINANVDGATLTAYGNNVKLTAALGTNNNNVDRPTAISGAMIEPFATNYGILYESGARGTATTYGLVETNYGQIIKSYSALNMTGVSTAAGLVTDNYGTITYSYYSGRIEASISAYGLVYSNKSNSYIVNSYTVGNLSSESNYPIDDDGSNGNIIDCYYDLFNSNYAIKTKGYGATTTTLMEQAFANDLNWYVGDTEFSIKYEVVGDVVTQKYVTKLSYNYGYPILSLGSDWSVMYLDNSNVAHAGKEMMYYNSMFTGDGKKETTTNSLLLENKPYEIITPGQFEYHLYKNYQTNTSSVYKLINDLDFDGFIPLNGSNESNYGANGAYESTYYWTSEYSKLKNNNITGKVFNGTIDGNNKTMYNINSVNGIIPRANNITLNSLTVKNSVVNNTTLDSCGMLVSIIEGQLIVSDVTLLNISVNGVGKATYVGLAFGSTGSTSSTINNLIINKEGDQTNNIVTSTKNNTYIGGIIGCSNSTIDISGSDKYEIEVNLPNGAKFGGLVGQSNNSIIFDTNISLDINHIFTRDNSVAIGGLVGEQNNGGTIAPENQTPSSLNVQNGFGSYTNDTQTYVAQYTGGIVGILNEGTINNLILIGNKTLTGYTVGGVVGLMKDGNISYSEANINSLQLVGNTMGGIVGEMTSGKISDIQVCTITFADKISSFDVIGGVVGKASGTSQISNVTIENSLSNTDATASKIGGVIGYVLGNTTTISISSCTNNWTPTVSDNGGNIQADVGGIIGYINSGIINIENTTNAAALSINNTDYVGGLIGHVLNATVNLNKDISNTSSVVSKEHAGGFIGYAENIILTLDNQGTKINSGSVTSDYSGGFVGCIDGGSITIKNTNNDSIKNTGSIIARTYAGGLFGFVNATINIEYVKNSGTVGIELTSKTASAGGIFGRLESSSISIKNTYNTAAIGNNGHGVYAGGIAGYVAYKGKEQQSIITANNSGEVGTATVNNNVAVSEQSYVGGIVGYTTSSNKFVSNQGDSTDPTANIALLFVSCTNTGVVHGKPSTLSTDDKLTKTIANQNNAAMAGGIVGYGEKIAISNSTNSANIGSGNESSTSGTTVGNAGQNNSGGIAGIVTDSVIYKSSNNDSIIGGGSGKIFVSAGIVAYAKGDSLVQECTNNSKYIDGTISAGIVGVSNDSSIIDNVNNNNIGYNDDSVSGGIVGVASATTIEGSINKGHVMNTVVGGGIVAIAQNQSIITNCINQKDVVVLNQEGFFGMSMAGGIVAYAKDATISNCTSQTLLFGIGGQYSTASGGIIGYMESGTIQGGTDDKPITINGSLVKGKYAGGIVGYIAATKAITITNIINKNNVLAIGSTSTSQASAASGGIVGYINSINDVFINNCSNKAYIDNITNNAGGAVGQVGNSSTYAKVQITNFNNTGTIIGFNAGGIIAEAYIANETGTVVSSSKSTGNIIAAYGDIGGIIGVLRSTNNIVAVDSSTNTGKITIGIDNTERSIGGIAGFVQNANIKNSTNSGDVTSTTSNQLINFGGVVGHIRDGEVNNCINERALKFAGRVGGVVGTTSGTTVSITKSTNKGAISNSTAAAGIVAYTTAETTNVTNCINDGTITSSECAGGIVGKVTKKTSVSTSTNNSVITSKIAGGIAGQATGTLNINNSTNNAKVTNNCEDDSRVGGIVGEAKGGGSIANVKVKNNTTIGSSTAEYAGGIAGALENFGTIQARGIDGLSTAIASGYNSFSVEGKTAGGVIGSATKCIIPLSKLLTSQEAKIVNEWNPGANNQYKAILDVDVNAKNVAGAAVGQISSSTVYMGGITMNEGLGYFYLINLLNYTGNVKVTNSGYAGIIGKAVGDTNMISLFGNDSMSDLLASIREEYNKKALIDVTGLKFTSATAGIIIGDNASGTKTLIGGIEKFPEWGINVVSKKGVLTSQYSGGFVGKNSGNLIIKNSTIKSFNTNGTSTVQYVGGMLALNEGNVEIENCVVQDSLVDASGTRSGNTLTAGGFIAISTKANTTITNSKLYNSTVQSSRVISITSSVAVDRERSGSVYGTYKYSTVDDTNGYQKLDGINIDAAVCVGGLIGQASGGTFEGNTLEKVTISHNVASSSDSKRVNNLYPIGGKIIGYNVSGDINISGNKETNVTIAKYSDNFYIFTTLYYYIVPVFVRIDYGNLYYISQERSYFGNYNVGKVGGEGRKLIENGNVSFNKTEGRLYAPINNVSTNATQVSDSQYGYCKITKYSNYGNVIKLASKSSFSGHSAVIININNYVS